MPRFLVVVFILLCIQGAAFAQGLVGAPVDPCSCGGKHPHKSLGLVGPPTAPRFAAGAEVGFLIDSEYDRSVETCRVVTAVVAVITLLFCRWRIRLFQAKVFESARPGNCIAVLGRKSETERGFWYAVAVVIPVAIYVTVMSLLQPSCL